jgi:hypothetical protein
MIKYLAAYGEINPVTVVKETAKQYVIEEKSYWSEKLQQRRVSKESRFESYFDTWQEAHAHIVSLSESAVESCANRLESAKSKLEHVRGMKEPLDTGAKG